MALDQNQLILLIGIGIAVLALVIWLFLRANRTARVIDDEGRSKDVLDEGAAPAARNQALIDAPSGVAQNLGQTSANATSNLVAAAGATADAEAGPSITPTKTAPPELAQAAPTPAPTPPSVAPSTEADDLRKIKGLGPKLVAMLSEQGITRFDQIAAWTDADVERIDATLGRFAGRITRDQWVEQAKLLSAGDGAGFSDRFGQDG